MDSRMPRINVELPDNLHRRVKAAAALAGLSLRDYVVAVFDGELPPPAKEKP